MKRIINNDGTITWRITFTGISNSEFERALAALNYNCVVVESTNNLGTGAYVEFTAPEHLEDLALNFVNLEIQHRRYMEGFDKAVSIYDKNLQTA